MLSHMTMAAPVALVALWTYLERRAALGPAAAMRGSVRLMMPALLATAAVVTFVFAAAAASPTGMQLGGYLPFSWREFCSGAQRHDRLDGGADLLRDWVAPLSFGGDRALDRRCGRRNGSAGGRGCTRS